MGAYLSEPITNKETQLEENEELRVASSSMQGWRVSQEVSIALLIELNTTKKTPRHKSWAYISQIYVTYFIYHRMLITQLSTLMITHLSLLFTMAMGVMRWQSILPRNFQRS